MTREELLSVLDYDASTGLFTWRKRPNAQRWNGRYAGKLAGGRTLNGYRTISVGATPYYASRLAWLYYYGEWPGRIVDHINVDKDDNRIENLRLATKSQNAANAKAQSRIKSGLKGAYRNGRNYSAKIKVSGRSIYLGQFDTAEAAHAAYISAAQRYFSEFARAA
jgi:hypothetical protein